MTGPQVRWESAPLDIRIALDAARMVLGDSNTVDVRCRDRSLMPEIRQRFEEIQPGDPASSFVWVDPDERDIAVPESCTRIVIIRRGWSGRGVTKRLGTAGFRQVGRYGVHSPASIILFRIGRLFAWAGRFDLADRLRHRSQVAFVTSGRLAGLSMVQVLVASRGRYED